MPLAIVLVAAVGLSFGLALQAYDAARSHRETAEAVLRDYAEVAASEYARTARGALSVFFDVAFDDIPRRVRGERLEPLVEIRRDLDDAMRVIDCACPGFRHPTGLLRVELPGGERVTEGAPVPPGVVDEVVAEARSRYAAQPRERYGLVHLSASSPPAFGAAAYGTVVDEDGSLAAVYAVLLAPEALAQLARHVQRSAELLPSAITNGIPTDSLLSITVSEPSGTPVLASRAPYPRTFSARDTLGAAFGSLVVEASIHPEAAGTLVIGGLPRSRLPMSIGLLVLTLAVGAVGLLQVRRHEQLGRLREAFVSSVSHELRTPLTQIRMLAELLEDEKLRTGAERARAVHVIRREAQRLTQLVENVLQFSRMRAAREPVPPPPPRGVDLRQTVAEVLASFQPLAESSDASLAVEVAPGLEVYGRSDAVRRILLNLLDNALKYGPPGQTVRVRAHAENGKVRLAVEDQGPGVPPADRESIWEPYRRLPRDVESLRPGSGMGLAVARELAQQYGGATWVEDAPGAGARFVVELPRWTEAGPAERS
ncbi:MAG TPA: HAMP domain-containing sensor histidine kinase [Longimicrobiales bacterium]|nr:HAMP domain-containing sensor histidine kinase [Longimicrobiales bacterium]